MLTYCSCPFGVAVSSLGHKLIRHESISLCPFSIRLMRFKCEEGEKMGIKISSFSPSVYLVPLTSKWEEGLTCLLRVRYLGHILTLWYF